MAFATLKEFAARLRDMPGVDSAARDAATAREEQLTKPPGALGRLEEVAAWYCAWSGRRRPRLVAPQIVIFAGNHGVAGQGVSAFPADVTKEMVANFRAGGAAINQLAAEFGARLDVHALDLDRPTADFTQAPAMTVAECAAALGAGWDAVDAQADLLIAGEMGIANTTSAAALALALFGGTALDWTGAGTGLDAEGMARKAAVVAAGAERHAPVARADALEVLRRLGGREIAAMAGAIARARALRIPVILDGFICCAAAACLECRARGALDHAIAGHLGAEPGHARLLERLGKPPLLSLGMRLGEASGAAVALAVVRAALACHAGMATFAEAGVSDG